MYGIGIGIGIGMLWYCIGIGIVAAFVDYVAPGPVALNLPRYRSSLAPRAGEGRGPLPMASGPAPF